MVGHGGVAERGRHISKEKRGHGENRRGEMGKIRHMEIEERAVRRGNLRERTTQPRPEEMEDERETETDMEQACTRCERMCRERCNGGKAEDREETHN